MNLLVGATGALGGLIARTLTEQAKPVRALVRHSAVADKVAALDKAGVELSYGDLKDRGSLDRACAGVKTVISTATAIVSRQVNDTLHAVDELGHFSLIDAAEQAGVEHIVFVSIHAHPGNFPLQDAKRAVEARLRRGKVGYTIVQSTSFMEVWLGSALWPTLGFDFTQQRARVAGDGTRRWNWISALDVARFVAGCVDNPRVHNRTFELGGPESLSVLEVVAILERYSGRPFKVEHIAREELSQLVSAATDPFDKSFKALLYSLSEGYDVDNRAAMDAIPLNLQSVNDYAASIFYRAQ